MNGCKLSSGFEFNCCKNPDRIKKLFCNECEESKEPTEFYPRKTSKTGYRSVCKVCFQKQNKINYKLAAEKYKNRPEGTPAESKPCTRCKKWRTPDEYPNSYTTKSGKRSICKVCKGKENTKYPSKKKTDSSLLKPFYIDGVKYKRCSGCEDPHLFTNFHSLAKGKYGVASICKICAKKYRKESDSLKGKYSSTPSLTKPDKNIGIFPRKKKVLNTALNARFRKVQKKIESDKCQKKTW